MKHILDYAYCLFVIITVVFWIGYSEQIRVDLLDSKFKMKFMSAVFYL
jgi:hypothetical protein